MGAQLDAGGLGERHGGDGDGGEHQHRPAVTAAQPPVQGEPRRAQRGQRQQHGDGVHQQRVYRQTVDCEQSFRERHYHFPGR